MDLDFALLAQHAEQLPGGAVNIRGANLDRIDVRTLPVAALQTANAQGARRDHASGAYPSWARARAASSASSFASRRSTPR